MSTSRIARNLVGRALSERDSTKGGAGVRVGEVTEIKPDGAVEHSRYEGSHLVKVKLRALHEDGKEATFWAPVMQQMAGITEFGFHFFPEVGDQVLVAQMAGDVDDAIVLGGLYTKKTKATKAHPTTKDDADVDFRDEKNNARGIVSRAQAHLLFWDEDGKELVEIRTKSGHILCFKDEGGKEAIELYDKDRSQWLEINVPDKKITLQTDTGEIYVKAKNTITMECKDFILKAEKTIKVESGTSSEWKAGSTMKQESGSTFDIEAGGTLTEKAPKIDLNP